MIPKPAWSKFRCDSFPEVNLKNLLYKWWLLTILLTLFFLFTFFVKCRFFWKKVCFQTGWPPHLVDWVWVWGAIWYHMGPYGTIGYHMVPYVPYFKLKPKSIITRRRVVRFQWFVCRNGQNFASVLFQGSNNLTSFIHDDVFVCLLFVDDLIFKRHPPKQKNPPKDKKYHNSTPKCPFPTILGPKWPDFRCDSTSNSFINNEFWRFVDMFVIFQLCFLNIFRTFWKVLQIQKRHHFWTTLLLWKFQKRQQTKFWKTYSQNSYLDPTE